MKVAGKWRYVYRAVAQYGQIIDVYVSARRDTRTARRAAIDELMPGTFHNTEQYANNRIECDHGRLKARLRPMRGLSCDRSVRGIVRGGHRVRDR